MDHSYGRIFPMVLFITTEMFISFVAVSHKTLTVTVESRGSELEKTGKETGMAYSICDAWKNKEHHGTPQ
jgi:hypothetical protein